MGGRIQPFLKWENLFSAHFIENQLSYKNCEVAKTVQSDTPGLWVTLDELYNFSELQFPHL